MSDAFDLMVGVFRSPARSATLRTRELPEGMLDVIRIAAGDEETIAAAKSSTALDESDLNVAAGLMLHDMLFFEGADSYRALGVRRDAEDSQIKRHYRWLVRWLHPDRNPDNMHSVFADRINRAWNSVRTEERRASYDLTLGADATADSRDAETFDTSDLLRQWGEKAPAPWLSGRLARRLPRILAFGAAFVALAALALAAWVASLGPLRPSNPLTEDGSFVVPKSAATVPAPSSMAASLPTPKLPPPTSDPLPPTLSRAAEIPVVAASLSPAPAKAPELVHATTPAIAAPKAPPPKVATASTTPAPITDVPTATPLSPVAGVAADPPIAMATPEAKPETSPAALSVTDVAEFADRFQRLYAEDDVEHFLRLFSPQVTGNSGGFSEIASDYRRLFSQRKLRRLSLSSLHWQIEGDTAVGNGAYETWVGAASAKPEGRTRGQIMLELHRSNDGVHITQLRHTVSE